MRHALPRSSCLSFSLQGLRAKYFPSFLALSKKGLRGKFSLMLGAVSSATRKTPRKRQVVLSVSFSTMAVPAEGPSPSLLASWLQLSPTTVLWNGGGRLVGQGLHHTSLHTPHATCRLKRHLGVFLFPSLLGPVVGEMPSAARYAAVGMVVRPFSHVVRAVLCEGDEGIAEVREQHRYPPSASAVREPAVTVVGDRAVFLRLCRS